MSFCRPLSLVAEGMCYPKGFVVFLKDMYGEIPCAFRTLEEYYHVNTNTFEKQYKDDLSDFCGWEQLRCRAMDYLSREHRFEHLDRRGNSEQRRTYTIVINRGGKKRS